MSKEWKDQFQEALANLAKEAAADKAAKETREAPIRKFLYEDIHAKEILEIVQKEALQGKGTIREIFLPVSFETVHSETIPIEDIITASTPEGETTEIGRSVRYIIHSYSEPHESYLAGIALDDIPTRVLASPYDYEQEESIYIGLLGLFYKFGVGRGSYHLPTETTDVGISTLDTIVPGSGQRRQTPEYNKMKISQTYSFARGQQAYEIYNTGLETPKETGILDPTFWGQAQSHAQQRVKNIVMDMLKNRPIR